MGMVFFIKISNMIKLINCVLNFRRSIRVEKIFLAT